MKRGQGRPQLAIALIDGPVARDLPDLASAAIYEIPGKLTAACTRPDTVACRHGTFVAGVLAARRGSAAPAICPGCTFLVRSIFAEAPLSDGDLPSATPRELAEAIVDSVAAAANVINLSAALVEPSLGGESELEQALDYAAQNGVITVAAAGNQGTVGSSVITRHPWVIPVTACDLQSRPFSNSNLGRSIGWRGLTAPGERVTSLGADGRPQTFAGTSAAAPFVTGAIGLLWSEFPYARASDVKVAVTRSDCRPEKSLVPPLLDAWAAYQALSSRYAGGRCDERERSD